MFVVYDKDKQRIPIKVWLNDRNDLGENCLAQATNLANLPFAFHHIALCPDTHVGYGMPIGGVMATSGMVIPNAVGLDIGRGMVACKLNIQDIEQDVIKKIMEQIRKKIPVGFSHNIFAQLDLMPKPECSLDDYPQVGTMNPESISEQIGTLGGGNHFIEIQKGDDGHIWFMIHSGSRNLGKQIADYHNKVAVDLNERWFTSVPKEWKLAFLPIDSNEGQAYLREMRYALDFAYNNRQQMKKIISDIFGYLTNAQIVEGEEYNIHHNYATMEHHFGTNVMIHRKGAIRARSGEKGIVPGSQGTNSYIVMGNGSEDSFLSSSHGSGRKMGRNEAVKNLDFDEEVKKLDDQGIIHAVRNKNDLEEASGAYKDIAEVMNSQADLTTPIVKLQPLAVIKG